MTLNESSSTQATASPPLVVRTSTCTLSPASPANLNARNFGGLR
jgi:hypothetical protein